MKLSRTTALLALCLLAGCSKTFRPPAEGGPTLAVHPVVAAAAPGAVEFMSDATPVSPDRGYYFPDRQLAGLRVESVSTEAAGNTNHVHVQLSAADRDRLRAFAAAHPEAEAFALRFESTPAGPEPGGGIARGAVVVQVFKISELTEDGRLGFTRSTIQDADAFAKKLVGR